MFIRQRKISEGRHRKLFRVGLGHWEFSAAFAVHCEPQFCRQGPERTTCNGQDKLLPQPQLPIPRSEYDLVERYLRRISLTSYYLHLYRHVRSSSFWRGTSSQGRRNRQER
jgi:hypothetical protein